MTRADGRRRIGLKPPGSPAEAAAILAREANILAYPFWALVIIAVDVVALYALCAYGSRENLAV